MDRPLTIEELLDHAGWLRSLAASLVSDPAHADDLVQETWIAALRHPPQAGPSPRLWLARVVRNLAHNSRRTDVRRDDRELRARDERTSPSPASIAQEAEAQRLLADAIAKLDEPLREVVVLRYFRGLDSNQIGKTLGVPSGTVRWRLKRALEELRAQLDRNFKGGREAWGTFLGSLLTPASTSPPSLHAPQASVATSPTVVATIALKAAAVLLVAAGGVTAWKLVGSEGSAGHRAEQNASAEIAAPASAANETLALAADNPDRAPAISTNSGSQDPTTTAPEDRVELCGVILVDGRPPTRPIELALSSDSALANPRIHGGHARPGDYAKQVVRPEQAGAFSFGLLSSKWSGTVAAEGCVFASGEESMRLDAPAGGLVLRLRSLPAITGRVVDPERGLPVPGARYSCEVNVQSEASASTYLFGKCDDEGRFRILITDGQKDPNARVDGLLLLEVPDRGRRVLAIARFVRIEGVDLGDVELEPARSVTFQLRDQRGHPIQGGEAKLEEPRFTMTTKPTDEHGLSVLDCVPSAGASVRFGASRYADRVVTLSPGEDVDVILEPIASLAIQLVAAEGSTLPETRVIVRAQQRMFVGQNAIRPEVMVEGSFVRSCTYSQDSDQNPTSITLSYAPDDKGGILLTGLLPNVPFQIEVRDSNERTLVLREESVGAQEWRRIEIPIVP